MPPGSHKNLEATSAQPTEQHNTAAAAAAKPNWNVSNREQLAQIRQERAPQVATAAQQQRRPEVHQTPSVAQQRPEVHAGQTVQRPGQQTFQRPDTHMPGRTNPEVATNRGTYGHTATTEINRTTTNNRYENQTHNTTNNRYLYGGLAGGALLGAGAASLYQNREYGQNYNGQFGSTQQFSNPNFNSWNSSFAHNNNWNNNNWNNYNNYNNYSNFGNLDYVNLNNFGNQGYDQFGNQLNYGYDQYGNQIADNSVYLNNGAYGDQYGTLPPSSIYGDTTYGGAPFDSGFIPAPPVNVFDSGYGRPNPMAVIPQLFGSILGGVLGNITSSHHRRYYGGFPDC